MTNLYIKLNFCFFSLYLALKMFIEEKGKDILEKNLYKNFVIHVCNLFEFGVISSTEVFDTVKVNNT